MKVRNGSMKVFLVGGLLAMAPAFAADSTRIVNEGQLAKMGITSDSTFAPPGYPASLASGGDSVCVTIGYNIDDNGNTSNFGVLKSWSTSTGEERPAKSYWDDVVNVAAGSVSDWKFRKADGGKLSPVYTAATFTFRGTSPIEASELRDNCRINDLTAFVQGIKADRYRNRSADTYALEQLKQRSIAQRNMVSNPGPTTPPSR